MDVLSLTFREVADALAVKPHQLKPLRAVYRTLVNGGVPASKDWPLTADVLPIVRTLEDGDLTKFVQRTHDGLETETVIVPMRGYDRAWKTLCVSSQVGCARGCAFCETAQLGLVRNLTASEIVGQVTAAKRLVEGGPIGGQSPCCQSPKWGQTPASLIHNVVFMGMGEPLDNYDHVVQAIRVLTERSGLSFAVSSITVSTVGRIQSIRKLAALGWRRLNVAVSLNAPNDEIRAPLMPVTRTDPMPALREALLEYPLRKCQFFMIEYVLIPGVNDAAEHARELADYLRPIKSVVNVIPYNPRRDSPWPAPTEDSVVNFMTCLQDAGQMCKRRLTKGRDQMAACGQLGNRDLARPRNAGEYGQV